MEDLAGRFVRIRAVRMNAVDLARFDFDWDLTWAAFFLNGHGHVYARYGTRRGQDAEESLDPAGLRRVMERVLEIQASEADRKPSAVAPRRPEQLRSLPSKLRSGAECLHCHQALSFSRRDDASFRNEEAREYYPLPENLGIELDPADPARVRDVAAGSAAAKAGVRKGDELLAVEGERVLSAGDVSWVLHRRPAGAGKLALKLRRGGEELEKSMPLAKGWKERPIFWRGSMWALRPAPGFGGRDLPAEEKRKLGVGEGAFAMRIGYFVDWGEDAELGARAKKAGLQKGDVVVAAGGRTDFASEGHFQEWFRLTARPGRPVPLAVIRGGKRVAVELPVGP